MKINRTFLVYETSAEEFIDSLNTKIQILEDDHEFNEIIDIKYSANVSFYTALILYNTNEPL